MKSEQALGQRGGRRKPRSALAGFDFRGVERDGKGIKHWIEKPPASWIVMAIAWLVVGTGAFFMHVWPLLCFIAAGICAVIYWKKTVPIVALIALIIVCVMAGFYVVFGIQNLLAKLFKLFRKRG